MRKNDLKKSPVKEGLADLAQRAESDHEVQMARAELYKLAKYSIKLHEMLKGVSEQEGLEGWVQSKRRKRSNIRRCRLQTLTSIKIKRNRIEKGVLKCATISN